MEIILTPKNENTTLYVSLHDENINIANKLNINTTNTEFIYQHSDINTPYIQIETLEKILNELKSKNCKVVSIFYHVDHDEYEFYGNNI